jgi:hypothetical protein
MEDSRSNIKNGRMEERGYGTAQGKPKTKGGDPKVSKI